MSVTDDFKKPFTHAMRTLPFSAMAARQQVGFEVRVNIGCNNTGVDREKEPRERVVFNGLQRDGHPNGLVPVAFPIPPSMDKPEYKRRTSGEFAENVVKSQALRIARARRNPDRVSQS